MYNFCFTSEKKSPTAVVSRRILKPEYNSFNDNIRQKPQTKINFLRLRVPKFSRIKDNAFWKVNFEYSVLFSKAGGLKPSPKLPKRINYDKSVSVVESNSLLRNMTLYLTYVKTQASPRNVNNWSWVGN